MEKQNKKVYWKGVEQLTNDPHFVKNEENEFPQHLPIQDAYGDNSGEGTNRRDFLKLMGFSVAAVSMAACEAPVKKAIPYLNKPEEVDPGVPNYYASTYMEGGDYCAVLVKTREGRPIKVEGNNFSSVSYGGTNARVQASVLGLYDIEKTKNPSKQGQKTDWATADKEIKSALEKAAGAGSAIYIVSNTLLSPSTKKVIRDFQEKYPSAKLVMYDQESQYAIAKSHSLQYGKAVVPSYDFAKADVVVSFDADFLGNWVSDIEFSKQYADNRKVNKNKRDMNKHFQFETRMSLTGANADYRTALKPSQLGLAVAKLHNIIAKKTGGVTVNVPNVEAANIDIAANELLKAQGKSLVVSGINDVSVQALVNNINEMLGNYNATVDVNAPSYQKQGDDLAMKQFVNDLGKGRVGAVIFYNTNPVYDHPLGSSIKENISKAKISIATNDRLNETASLCTYNCPDSHFLESWNDAEPKHGKFSLGQPTISTIFDTRQVQDSLITWMGGESSFHDYLKNFWKESIFTLQSEEAEFEKFWIKALHDGIFEPTLPEGYQSVHQSAVVQIEGEVESTGFAYDIASVAGDIKKNYSAEGKGTELVLYASPVMGVGTQANNPILQETPEPISKVCWGNFVSVPQKMATELGFTKFETKTSVAKLTVNGNEITLPVIVQPGQANGTVSINFGYGKNEKHAGKVAAQAAGVNAFQFASLSGDVVSYSVADVKIEATGDMEEIAQTQTHNTFMGRETIIQETTLAEYKKNPAAGSYKPKISTYQEKEDPSDISLWDIDNQGYKRGEAPERAEGIWMDRLGLKADTHHYNNHHWGMMIDLNACNGCSACIVACNVENNVPVVGKEEVVKRREMHWLRIDRYYSSPKGASSYEELEQVAENPEVVFQPMMCQHCNNAPCETVCPVAATTHSSEGLNQMTYNRCVGTKYCANNCPYKVRRFNWFKYHTNDEFDYYMNNDLGKMVLNPDVTVRSRGVMEKCSMCVQRIQTGKLKAKREGRLVNDGDVSTACASACPSNAITFGDLNDQKSGIRTAMESELEERAYNVLQELAVNPNIWYLTKVRNNEESVS
ncbi:TAT-variant-translocated molybdopterin oxidoreductase [Rapidithrix thailandica]|uniref:TAT-variant-translocated molybdopterin oxidoreductase n=1 Tax=Rapidithrix thailandica TaxID=413964 RepID=A0AAW9RZC7_9BACT